MTRHYVCIVWIGGLSPRLRGTRPLTGKCNGRPSLNDTIRSEFKDRLSGTISQRQVSSAELAPRANGSIAFPQDLSVR